MGRLPRYVSSPPAARSSAVSAVPPLVWIDIFMVGGWDGKSVGESCKNKPCTYKHIRLTFTTFYVPQPCLPDLREQLVVLLGAHRDTDVRNVPEDGPEGGLEVQQADAALEGQQPGVATDDAGGPHAEGNHGDRVLAVGRTYVTERSLFVIISMMVLAWY